MHPELRSRLTASAARSDWRAADAAAGELLRVAPDDPDALFLGGVAAIEVRRPQEAIERLRRATSVAPDRADAWTQLARAFAMVHRVEDAVSAAERAIALMGSESRAVSHSVATRSGTDSGPDSGTHSGPDARPADAHSLDTLGVVFSRANRHERAVELFERAVRAKPRNAAFQFNLASSAKFLGRFDQAEAAYEACLQVEPRFWKAHSALSQLRTQTSSRNHVGRLAALLETATDVDARLHLSLALSKECEDLGRHAEAFRLLASGKAAKRATVRYEAADDAALFSAMEDAFSATLLSPAFAGDSRAPHDPESVPATASGGPIFVVGMPRTGTTLVDRILSSHSQVASAGELQDFPLAIKRISGVRSPRVLDLATLRAAATADLSPVGPAYRARAQAAGNADGRRTVDKMPLNFLYAGFIAKALPDARIVCLRREPLDACLANFRQLFAIDWSYYDYAWDLLDTGRYYLGFDRLMAHWRRLLPGRFLEIRYEDLVLDQEATTRRLLEHCGLPFEEACLAFERNAAPVSTASSVQVRSPLYRTSLERWRRYESELEPLRKLFASAGVTTS